jgi:hypothetical protein
MCRCRSRHGMLLEASSVVSRVLSFQSFLNSFRASGPKDLSLPTNGNAGEEKGDQNSWMLIHEIRLHLMLFAPVLPQLK